MSLILDANPEILDLAFADLIKGHRSDTGRNGMTAVNGNIKVYQFRQLKSVPPDCLLCL